MPPSYALTNTAPEREKNGEQAIGRSRGGLTTKIHALVDALGNPVDLMLTPGQAHDLACAEPLLERADPKALLGDKAYDADALIATLNKRQITPVIPPKANRKTPRRCPAQCPAGCPKGPGRQPISIPRRSPSHCCGRRGPAMHGTIAARSIL